MAHTFDNGSGLPQRTLLQKGVISLLEPLRYVPGTPPSGGYVVSILPFGGVVWSTQNDGPDVQSLIRHFARMPAIGVATGTRSAQTATVNKQHAIGQCELIIYFASKHARDQYVGRHEMDVTAQADDHADPGLHVMMEHTLELLLGQWPTTLTSTVKQLEFRSEEEVITLPELTLWRQLYNVTMTSLIPTATGQPFKFRTAKQLLESIGWRVVGESGETLPSEPSTKSTSVDKETDGLKA